MEGCVACFGQLVGVQGIVNYMNPIHEYTLLPTAVSMLSYRNLIVMSFSEITLTIKSPGGASVAAVSSWRWLCNHPLDSP